MFVLLSNSITLSSISNLFLKNIMSTETKELTLFEKIANHQIPSTIVYEDDKVVDTTFYQF